MIYEDYPEIDESMETPGEWPGGLPFNAGFIVIVVMLTGLLIGFLLIRLNPNMEKTPSNQPSSMGKGGIAPLFTPEVQYWAFKILPWSEAHGLDPNLVATVMQIESCGHSQATSSAGAMGLFQVMPYHFAEADNPYKPNINANAGLTYLKKSLEAGGGDIRLALAGYNGGITGASRPESNWPAETVRFVYWGMQIYKDAANGKPRSDRLDEWLANGGASLCQSAAENLNLDG